MHGNHTRVSRLFEGCHLAFDLIRSGARLLEQSGGDRPIAILTHVGIGMRLWIRRIDRLCAHVIRRSELLLRRCWWYGR